MLTEEEIIKIAEEKGFIFSMQAQQLLRHTNLTKAELLEIIRIHSEQAKVIGGGQLMHYLVEYIEKLPKD